MGFWIILLVSLAIFAPVWPLGRRCPSAAQAGNRSGVRAPCLGERPLATPSFLRRRRLQIAPVEHAFWPFSAKIENRGGAGFGPIVAAERGKKEAKRWPNAHFQLKRPRRGVSGAIRTTPLGSGGSRL